MADTDLTDEARAEAQTEAVTRRRAASRAYAASPLAILFKIVLLGALNAFAGFAVMALLAHHHLLVAGVVIVATALLDVIYIPSNRFLPAKYLAPGVVFLIVFQLFVVVYSFYISFTNYGDGHMGSKEDAIAFIQLNTEDRLPDSPGYKVTILDKDGTLGMAIVDPADHKPKAGLNGKVLHEVVDAKVQGDKVTEVPGYQVLTFSELLQRQQELKELKVSWSDKPTEGTLRTADATNAYRYVSRYRYDAAADTLTDKDGKVYHAQRGVFVDDAGKELPNGTGWSVPVGLDNYKRAFTDPEIRGPFVAVLLWTFAFALLSVALSFAVGLFLAIVFNDPRIRLRKLYRTLLILPYAIPAFVSALIWSGLMNKDYGFINQVLLGGLAINWLDDPTWSKIALLIVNTWLGYPYMFLVCTGALQSIPEEALEAAKIDGASVWQTFRQIKLPLLMVPLAPLLISSFAFNFNNFTLIYLLTRGGPRFNDDSTIGHTDVLISMVYKLAKDGQPDFGLASAFSILIFIIVGTISYLGFRRTKTLEDIN